MYPVADNGTLVFSKQNLGGVVCRSQIDKSGYSTETQIPFPSLKGVNLLSEGIFGFTFQINDFDVEDGDVLYLVWEGTPFNDVRTDRFAKAVFK